MLKSWMVIAGVVFAIALMANAIRPKDVKWFRRQQRPSWLTFEKLIPVIWSVVFVCGGWSAYIVWEKAPSWGESGGWMAAYILLELVTVAFTPTLLWSHNLKLGSYVGGAGFVVSLVLALSLLSVSGAAAALLIPYLLWSPIGTLTTWQMDKLN